MSDNNNNEIILPEVEDNFSISVPVQESNGTALSYGYYFRMGMPDPSVEDKLSLPKTGDLGKEINKFILTPEDKEGTKGYTEKFGVLLYALDKVNVVSPKINMSAMNVTTKSSRDLQYIFDNDKKKDGLRSIKYSTPNWEFRWSGGSNVKMESSVSKSFSISGSSSTKLGVSQTLSVAADFAWNLAGQLKYTWEPDLTVVSDKPSSSYSIGKYISFVYAGKDDWFSKTGKDSRELVENKTIISDQSIKLIVDKFEPNIIQDAVIYKYFNRLIPILAICASIAETISYFVLPNSVNKTSRRNARSQSANSSAERAGAYAKKADEDAKKAEKNGDNNANALRTRANEKKAYANAQRAEETANKYEADMNKSEEDVKKVEEELKKLEECEKKAEEESKSQDIKAQIALKKLNDVGGGSNTPEASEEYTQRHLADVKRSELISAKNKAKEKREELNRKKNALNKKRENFTKAREEADSLKGKGYNEKKEKEYDSANEKEYYAQKEKEKDDLNFHAIELSILVSGIQALALAVLAICSIIHQYYRDKKYSEHLKKVNAAADAGNELTKTGIFITGDGIRISNGKSEIMITDNGITISSGKAAIQVKHEDVYVDAKNHLYFAKENIMVFSGNEIDINASKKNTISSDSIEFCKANKNSEPSVPNTPAPADQPIADVAEAEPGSMDQLATGSNDVTSGAANLQLPPGA